MSLKLNERQTLEQLKTAVESLGAAIEAGQPTADQWAEIDNLVDYVSRTHWQFQPTPETLAGIAKLLRDGHKVTHSGWAYTLTLGGKIQQTDPTGYSRQFEIPC